MSGIEFISASVMHARLRPKQNRFRYTVPYVAIPAAALEAKRGIGLLSIDRANVFSVRRSDYGDGKTAAVDAVRGILDRWNVTAADGEIALVTIPRILGIGFNPVSFWLCCDADGVLRAVVSEVNNTFRERHFYLCAHADQRPIAPRDQITSAKVFHVSPFMKVEGEYRFAFAWSGDALGVRIDLYDADGLILTTSVAGKREPVTNRRLLGAFFANPLVMFKVLGLIHYQAARLFLKGIMPYRKPPPPAEAVTR